MSDLILEMATRYQINLLLRKPFRRKDTKTNGHFHDEDHRNRSLLNFNVANCLVLFCSPFLRVVLATGEINFGNGRVNKVSLQIILDSDFDFDSNV